ncbi:MAG: Mg-chelatase subunit ChlD, partial [Planctomycetota bacterium]
MNTPGNDRMHELLCAYLLDEVDASEKTQVEEALAASSDLRDERDRLEKTLGMVSSAYEGEDALSESAFASVLEQAEVATRPARPRFVLLRPTVMRAAAAVLFVVTGTWAWVQRGPGEAGDQQVAVASKADKNVALEQRAVQAPGRRDRGQASLEALGYGGGETEHQAELEHQRANTVEGMRSIGYGEGDRKMEALMGLAYAGGDSSASPSASRLRAIGYAQSDGDGARSATVSPQEIAALKGLGYAGDERPVMQDVDVVASAQEEVLETEGDPDMFADAPFDDKAFNNAIGVAGGAGGKHGVSYRKKLQGRAAVQRSRAPEPQLEALGYAGGTSVSSAEVASEDAPQPFGIYRGPGDTVPPGGVVDGNALKKQVALLDSMKSLQAPDPYYLGAGNEAAARGTLRLRETQGRDWSERIIHDCYPRPNDMPRDMYFRFWGDNSFELTELDHLSTFSVDVDTASYALARRYLNEGKIPTKAQIRTEEFLNSFEPDVPAPKEGTFAIQAELAPSRFGGDGARSMLRVGIRGREVAKSERKPLSITFVIDTSGSMRENDRLELVKHAVRLLVGELNGNDSIAIVSYSNDARIVLPLTSADQGGAIEAAIYPLQPNGSTNAEAGLMLGYQLAQAGLDLTHNHRVVFLSDGVANVGQTDQNRLAKSVRQNVDAGIYLNTIGVGMNNHNDVFLEQLADKGDGVCDYIDSAKAAKHAIVDRFTGAFE